MTSAMEDEGDIRRLVESWAIWRDTGDWDRLATAWSPDGRMVATWFDGTATDFIAGCRAGFGKAGVVQHVLGGSAVRVEGSRAVADTRVTLNLRTTVEGVLCDIACVGRFLDFLGKAETGWAIALRKLAYEKDRIDPVEPGARLTLDRTLLESFPPGYRHLAYAQAKSGMTVLPDLPGFDQRSLAAIEAWKSAWLQGQSASSLGSSGA